MGPHANFLQLVECARCMEDWGIMADLLWYQEYDDKYNIIHTKIHRLQLDLSTIEQDHSLCEQRLEASRCAEGLTHLEGLGPHTAHAKWGTCFTDDKEDADERPSTRFNH
jgi:hypothetical protein